VQKQLFRFTLALSFRQSTCPFSLFSFQFSGLFSALDEDIQLKFDKYNVTLNSYRSSLSFAVLDQLLTEFFPLIIIVSFLDLLALNEDIHVALSWIIIDQV
jgi:hypothetical protein